TGYLDRRPDGIEIDSPVANIIRKEENVISKIFIFIFNVKDYENILYTIKNYPDDSLLIMDNRNGAIYCEENKYIYYENIDNFNFYATYGFGRLPDIKESIHLNNEIIVKEIYAYSTNVMQLPPSDECNFIFVFGISNDNIFVKKVASIIIYDNEIYKEFGYFSAEEERGVALLNKEQSEYISKIIIENKW
ncbi:MAG: hypothetical protein LBI28_08870, partial [Treponema sp.]|nr:hypothetical protein [Treponema sp.]